MINKLNRYLILTQKIVLLESKRKKCKHDFTNYVYDPFVSSSSEIIPRYSMQCRKCGKKEYKFEEKESYGMIRKL